MEQRVSHADRDQVSEMLRVAAGDGRLSLEELEERLEACYAARTYADLAPLVADLPAGRLPVQAEPKDVVRVKRAGGNATYDGDWLVPKRLELEIRGGNVRLDFTAATVAAPVTEVHLDLRGGNCCLVVPDGYAVDADEVEFRGGSLADRRASRTTGLLPAAVSAPLAHRIVVTGQIRGGHLFVLPPRSARDPGWLRRLFGGGRGRA